MKSIVSPLFPLLAFALSALPLVSQAAVPATANTEDTVSPATAIARKLDAITFPRISFQDTALEEALDFFRNRAVESEQEPDTLRPGVNFVIRPARIDGRLCKPNKVSIDLELRNVTLRQAIDAVCLNGGLIYEINDYAVVIGFPREAAPVSPAPEGNAADSAEKSGSSEH